MDLFTKHCIGFLEEARRRVVVRDIARQCNAISAKMFLNYTPSNGKIWELEGEQFHVQGDSATGFLRHVISIFQLIDEALQFDSTHSTPNTLTLLANMNFSGTLNSDLLQAPPFSLRSMLSDSAQQLGLPLPTYSPDTSFPLGIKTAP